MAVFRCKMCDGDLNYVENATVMQCTCCRTWQTVPKVNEEEIQNLFNRANVLRRKCEFDKAEQVYERILEQTDNEPEAHWGMILCKYGIEYITKAGGATKATKTGRATKSRRTAATRDPLSSPRKNQNSR